MATTEPRGTKLPTASPPSGLRIAALVLRTGFLLTLMVMVVRVSLPQSETIRSAYETPADLVRLLLGVGVAIWLMSQLFRGPTDTHGYRTWLYLGLIAVPFGLICLFALW